ncbi:MAG: DUF418 domain-containing protein [Eudoraea sp.]|nr:DUF418 domain-containing protein [Eudoraea sp.]
MNNNPALKRIEIVDALRGFALAGIVIVHMVENYLAAPVPEGAMEASHQGVLDYVVDGFILLILRGKFFALFSFLFGLSFFIQMDKARQKGLNFGGRFLWRLLLLLVIGYFHSLFYRGDILTVYALLGILLIPFYKLNNTWVLGICALLFLGLGRSLIFIFFHGDNLFVTGELMPDSPLIIEYYNILTNGSLLDVFKTNAWDGHIMKMDFQLGIFSRGYLTFGFFLLGLFVGRIQFFRNFLSYGTKIKHVLYGSLGLFLLSIIVGFFFFAQLAPNVTFDNWYAMNGLTAFDLNNLAMTMIILCLFLMAYKRGKLKRWLEKFIPYGRMALTNYIVQSIIGTFIFYGWGLGYLGEIRNIYIFFISLTFIVLQMIFSAWWMRNFYYGPFEWLWRSLTYFRIFPMRKPEKKVMQ